MLFIALYFERIELTNKILLGKSITSSIIIYWVMNDCRLFLLFELIYRYVGCILRDVNVGEILDRDFGGSRFSSIKSRFWTWLETKAKM